MPQADDPRPALLSDAVAAALSGLPDKAVARLSSRLEPPAGATPATRRALLALRIALLRQGKDMALHPPPTPEPVAATEPTEPPQPAPVEPPPPPEPPKFTISTVRLEDLGSLLAAVEEPDPPAPAASPAPLPATTEPADAPPPPRKARARPSNAAKPGAGAMDAAAKAAMQANAAALLAAMQDDPDDTPDAASTPDATETD